uniref:Dolichol phosphate-mannose biosynthesis regulatory protein n=1 Tax=Culicoides sonorensis TaxID=179676 RepID=A0A336JZS0_CULSO
MVSNALIGKLILFVSVSIFIYYFFWVAVLPFMLVDEDNWIYQLFPPHHYAFLFPTIFGIIFIGGLTIYTLYHIRGYVQLF